MSLESDFDALLKHVASKQQDALSLLESLLQFCRVHEVQVVRATRDRRHRQCSTDANRAFVARLEQTDAKHTLVLPQQCTGDIAAICQALVAPTPPDNRDAIRCVAVRALAEALDGSHHARIRIGWTNRGARELRPNELVPVFSPFQRPAFRSAYVAVGTPPFKLDSSVDTTEHAVLVPDRLPHAAKLTAQPGWDGLDTISESSKVACALLSGLDFEISELDRDQRKFFGAAPAMAAEVSQRALQLVEQADHDGTHILLLPELSLDAAGAQQVARWVQDHAQHIALAVCGTYHAEDDAGRRNEALIASSISPLIKQRKIVGFDLELGAGAPALREDIEANDTPLLLITAQGWSALVLICRDFIDADLSELARKLRVSLILVPACSPRTMDFRAGAGVLASKAQAHVIVANKCGDVAGAPDCALLARPTADPRHAEISLSGQGLALPARASAQLRRGGWILDG